MTEGRAKDLSSVRALFVVLAEALARSAAVELFPVWAGDESDPPIGLVEVTRNQMTPEKFLFTQHFLYRIAN